MKITEFFEKQLKAPLTNQGWSWGAFDENKRLFFKVGVDDLEPNPDAPKLAILNAPWWTDSQSRGQPERLKHIAALMDGAEGFAVVYRADDRRKTKDFDRRFLLRLGKIIEGRRNRLCVSA